LIDAASAIDHDRDFYIGTGDCDREIILYGDYTSEACRRLRDILRRIAERLTGRIDYSYRQFPNSENADSIRAARAAIAASRQGKFWEMHEALFRRGQNFGADDIDALAAKIGLDRGTFSRDLESEAVNAHLARDRRSAEFADVSLTPSLFIEGKRYFGAWDELSILEAVERPLGIRVEIASQRFFGWAASGGFVLILATLAALVFVNAGPHDVYETIRHTSSGFIFGEARFELPLVVWINDGLMTIFFLIVGIEIKRELISGELSDLSSAMMPIIGAIGGMAAPALIYACLNWNGPAAQGWGVPMATDIAFTLGLMALLGRNVPNSLKIFVSALAIADDLGAIVVIALFYGQDLQIAPLGGAFICLVVMGLFNHGRVYALTPYLILGVVLWAFVQASGLHATLAGVLMAAMIPSRRTANVEEVAAQAAMLARETQRESKISDKNITDRAVRILERSVARLLEPGHHLQHALEKWTNFVILPLFAFVNTGIVLTGLKFSPLAPEILGVMLGLVIGKPLGICLTCWIAIRMGWASLSSEISWGQFLGAGCLAGVGFTMSIFIATTAFDGSQAETVKLAILSASVISAALGMTILTYTGKALARP